MIENAEKYRKYKVYECFVPANTIDEAKDKAKEIMIIPI